jgi:hemin uptake protein HemP
MTEAPDRNAQATATGIGMVKRITAQELLKQSREIEIDHEGKIYRLRLTQANKLILTA